MRTIFLEDEIRRYDLELFGGKVFFFFVLVFVVVVFAIGERQREAHIKRGRKNGNGKKGKKERRKGCSVACMQLKF